MAPILDGLISHSTACWNLEGNYAELECCIGSVMGANPRLGDGAKGGKKAMLVPAW
jgi:hypothetical protein